MTTTLYENIDSSDEEKEKGEEEDGDLDDFFDQKKVLEIEEGGVTNLICTLICCELSKVAIATYFLIRNIERVVEEQFWVNDVWIAGAGFSIILGTCNFCLISFLVCLFVIRKLKKWNIVLLRIAKYLLYLEFITTLFYIGTDTVLLSIGLKKYSEASDIFGDCMMMIVSFLGVLIYNFVDYQLLRKQVTPLSSRKGLKLLIQL